MRHFLQRSISLFILPCLISDPALAQNFTARPPLHSHTLSLNKVFQQQALSTAATSGKEILSLQTLIGAAVLLLFSQLELSAGKDGVTVFAMAGLPHWHRIRSSKHSKNQLSQISPHDPQMNRRGFLTALSALLTALGISAVLFNPKSPNRLGDTLTDESLPAQAMRSALNPLTEDEVKNPEAVRAKLLEFLRIRNSFDAEIPRLTLKPALGFDQEDLREAIREFIPWINDPTVFVTPLSENSHAALRIKRMPPNRTLEYTPASLNVLLTVHPDVLFHEISHLMRAQQASESTTLETLQRVAIELYQKAPPVMIKHIIDQGEAFDFSSPDIFPYFKDLLKTNSSLREGIQELLNHNWLSELQSIDAQMALLTVWAKENGYPNLTGYTTALPPDTFGFKQKQARLGLSYHPTTLSAAFLYETLVDGANPNAKAYFIALVRAELDPDFDETHFIDMRTNTSSKEHYMYWAATHILNLPPTVLWNYTPATASRPLLGRRKILQSLFIPFVFIFFLGTRTLAFSPRPVAPDRHLHYSA